MAPYPSHRLKLHRAEKHLEDLKAVVAEVGERRPYPVIETFDPEHEEWIYGLSLVEVEPPEMFPIVLGDFLFNARSALDHLIVAIAPAKFKDQVSFPVFTADPLTVHEHSGEYLHPKQAALWHRRTEGLPADCVTALRVLQPHETARQFSKRAVDQPLAILSALQNADKHRDLVGVVTGLTQAQVSIDGEVFAGIVPVLKNGAQIHGGPTQVNMEIEGSAVVGVGHPDEVRDFDRLCETILNFIAAEVLPRLETFLT